MKQLSLKWEMMLLCVLLVAVPTVLMGVVGFYAYQGFAESELESHLRQRASAIRTLAYDNIAQNRRILRREEVLVKKRIESLAETTREVLDSMAPQMATTDGRNAPLLFEQLRQLRVNRAGHVFLLNQQLQPVLNSELLTTASSAALTDSFFLRIQASLPELMAGDIQVIRYPWRTLENGHYIDRYTALAYAESLQMVIGVTISETDFRSIELEKKLQDDLRNRLSRETVGDTGYVWVLNSDSRYVVSRHNLRNGEDMSDVNDAHGRPLVEYMVEIAANLPRGETGLLYYEWRSLGQDLPEPKAAAITYVPEWDWVIGVSITLDEFYAGLQNMRETIAMICAAFILVGSVIAYLFAGMITRPVLHLKGVATQAAQGNLDVGVDDDLVRQQTEIGSLARAFALMIVNLRRAMVQREKAGQLLAEQNQALHDSEERLKHALDELELEKQKFHEMAITDPLTGLHNRRGFAVAGGQIWKSFARNRHDLTIAMLDIDYFKRINDQYGHAIGDIVLQDLARVLNENLRDADLVARIGGEEFALILEQPLSESLPVLERLRQEIEGRAVHITSEVVFYTVSIGAVAADQSQLSLDNALDAADSELYRAKSEGRNRICYSGSGTTEPEIV